MLNHFWLLNCAVSRDLTAGTEVVAAAIYPQATAAATAAAAIALKFHPKHEKRKQKTLTKRTNSH
jgi:hypothetical protein